MKLNVYLPDLLPTQSEMSFFVTSYEQYQFLLFIISINDSSSESVWDRIMMCSVFPIHSSIRSASSDQILIDLWAT